jgi:hypothetical protein
VKPILAIQVGGVLDLLAEEAVLDTADLHRVVLGAVGLGLRFGLLAADCLLDAVLAARVLVVVHAHHHLGQVVQVVQLRVAAVALPNHLQNAPERELRLLLDQLVGLFQQRTGQVFISEGE